MRALRAVGLAVVMIALLPAVVRALELSIGFPREHQGDVLVDVRLTRPFSSRIRESLSRAMPATLTLHVELWRARTGWFDRLESGYDMPLRLRYDVTGDDYLLERRNQPPLAVPTLDSLERALERPFALPVGRVDKLQDRRRYYVVVGVTLRPVSIEDADEIDDVIFPDGKSRGPGVGIITEVPRAIFDAVRNIAGLGDVRSRALSQTFEPGDLRSGQ